MSLGNPYQSLASVQSGNLDARDSADAGAPRLGGVIWTVLILDSLACSFRLIFGMEEAIYGCIQRLFITFPVVVILVHGLMAGIAGCGLIGNILILCRKRAGVSWAIASIFLVLAFDGIGIVQWVNRNHVDSEAVTGNLIHFVWLLFYGIVVWMAARVLRRPKQGKA